MNKHSCVTLNPEKALADLRLIHCTLNKKIVTNSFRYLTQSNKERIEDRK